MLRFLFATACLTASASASFAQSTSQTPAAPANDPPSNLYLVSAPGQIQLVSQFGALSACAVAAANWRYDQMIGIQANSIANTWIGLVCVATK
jgi:hypothetical protein